MVRKEHILEDLEDKIAMAIKAGPDSYSHGFLSARLIDFALCGWITQEELDGYNDRLEPLGLSNRFKPREAWISSEDRNDD